MSSTQDTTAPAHASVVLPPAESYNPRTQPTDWSSLAWSDVLRYYYPTSTWDGASPGSHPSTVADGTPTCVESPTVTIDISHHFPTGSSLPAQEGLEILHRNGLVWLRLA